LKSLEDEGKCFDKAARVFLPLDAIFGDLA